MVYQIKTKGTKKQGLNYQNNIQKQKINATGTAYQIRGQTRPRTKDWITKTASGDEKSAPQGRSIKLGQKQGFDF